MFYYLVLMHADVCCLKTECLALNVNDQVFMENDMVASRLATGFCALASGK